MTDEKDQPTADAAPEPAVMPDQESAAGQPGQQGQPGQPQQPPKVDLTFSNGLAKWLAANDVSLAFTSYQTGRLYLVGHGPQGKLTVHEAHYPQAMGVAGDMNRLYLGTLHQVVRMENALQPGQIANNVHDKVYVPRNTQTIGDVDIHELGIREDGKVNFINTKYSCIAEFSLFHSFKPVWKPTFVSRLAPEDRCHLNGMAMRDGVPRYVSAVCKSDVIDGWRDRRDNGGVIIDVESDKILAEGMSMPHSPRWHDDKVWACNSGSGDIGWIDTKKKTFNPEFFAPGFLRGLAFHNNHVITTLSKPRYKRFEGLALDGRLKEKDADAWCGVQIINMSNGNVEQWLRLDGGISEMFDICVLPGVKNPMTLGPLSPEILGFITIEAPDSKTWRGE